MKIRKAFVSNSSSSSFTCEICGNNVSGWDMCLSEAEMVECVNNHIFCEDEVSGDIDYLTDEDSKDYDEEWRYYLPSKHCPICKLDKVSDYILIEYFCNKEGITREELTSTIKAEYGDYDNFLNVIKDKNNNV